MIFFWAEANTPEELAAVKDMLAVIDKHRDICKDVPNEKTVKTRSEINHQNYLKRKSKKSENSELQSEKSEKKSESSEVKQLENNDEHVASLDKFFWKSIKQNDAERSKRYRANKKASQSITDSHEENVTQRDENVTNVMKEKEEEEREEERVLDSIKILTTGTMRVKNWREGSMSKIGNRKIGEDRPKVLHQKPDEVEDSMYIYSNEIEVPTQNVDYKDPNQIYDPLNSNIKKTTKSMARQITSDFINGTPTANPDGIVGLRYRIDTDLSTDQKIPASGTNGTALDLDPTGANYASNIRQFKRILDTAKDQCAETPDFILCNNTFINMQSSIWADSNYLKTTEDSLHRIFVDWDGVKYLDMGYEYDDKTKVIKDYEDANGVEGTPGTDKCTSIYLVKMGPEFWCAVQAAAMKVYDTHRDEKNINYLTQFDWEIGQLITHPRSVVRLYGLKMA